MSGVVNSIDKLDKVLDDTANTESMVNQVLYRIFTKQQGCDKALLPTGPEVQINEISFTAWKKLTLEMASSDSLRNSQSLQLLNDS